MSFREIKNLVFAKTFAKLSSFSKESFAKTKSEFHENFREKTKAKTFVPTLVSAFRQPLVWWQHHPAKLTMDWASANL
jgi:hypothetical protein